MSHRNPRRADFPLLAANPQLHYLDSAATSQKPRVVLDAMWAYYERDNANPHRGAYALSARATDRYHDARARVASFLGASDADCLIFTFAESQSSHAVSGAQSPEVSPSVSKNLLSVACHKPFQSLSRPHIITFRYLFKYYR